LLNSIFPNACENCGELFFFKTQNYFCDKCLSLIKHQKTFYCRSCGDGVTNCQRCLSNRFFKDIQVYTKYSPPISKIIHELKFNKVKTMSKIISNIIADDFKRFIKTKNITKVIYIPQSKKLEKSRGYNHLKEILVELVPEFMIFEGIKKIKETRMQMNLSKEERETNLIGAFDIEENADFKNQNVLIFDDVLTTGSTIREIFKLIKDRHINNIYGYIITKS